MKVLIIGGGASGMMAALSARKEGAEVCILERQARVGRKLLATGNGRCNLQHKADNEKLPRAKHGIRTDCPAGL